MCVRGGGQKNNLGFNCWSLFKLGPEYFEGVLVNTKYVVIYLGGCCITPEKLICD